MKMVFLNCRKEVLLSPDDTCMWCKQLCHVYRNRINGVKKKQLQKGSQDKWKVKSKS